MTTSDDPARAAPPVSNASADVARESPSSLSAAREEGGELVNLDPATLRVGSPVQIQTALNGERHYGKLIGCVPGVSILAHLPRNGAKSFGLEDGQPVVVRLFSGTDAYGFKSTVMRHCHLPVPYLHLAPSRKVAKVRVRHHQRVPIRIPVRIGREASASATFEGHIVDLSVTGACIRCDTPVAVGETVEVRFQTRFDAEEARFQARATVRSVHAAEGPDAGPREFGVEFTGTSLGERLLLMGLAYQAITDPRTQDCTQ